MGFEPRPVRKIDDARRDVIDGGISVIAGDGGRRRTAERRREAEQRASAEAGRLSLPLLANRRLGSWSRGRAEATAARRPPARMGAPIRTVSRITLRLSAGAARRPRDRHLRSRRMALRRLRLGGRAELGRTRRRQGEALGLADFGQITRRRLRQAGGRRDRRRRTGSRRERFEARQRERRRRNARGGFEARHLRGWASAAGTGGFNWASTLASMTMSPKGFETRLSHRRRGPARRSPRERPNRANATARRQRPRRGPPRPRQEGF